MQGQSSPDPRLSNTGVTHENASGDIDFGLQEYLECIDRDWDSQGFGASCPVSGRGVRFDGASLLMPPEHFEDFKKKLQEIFNSDHPFDLAPGQTEHYKEKYLWLHGIVLLTNPRHKSNCGEFLCQLLGKASRHLDLKDWCELILWVYDRGGHGSQVHLNIDDYRFTVTPYQMLQAVKQEGQTKTSPKGCVMSKGVFHFGVYSYHESGSKRSKKTGETISFGVRGKDGGGKHYCCYDKSVESKGELSCIRHELRLYNNKPEEFFAGFCEIARLEGLSDDEVESLLIDYISGVIYGAVDFRDVSDFDPELGKLKDCPRFEWWEEFIGFADSIKLPAKKKNLKTFDNAMQYLRKQVAPTLACIFNCLAQLKDTGEFVEALMWELWFLGEEKMSLRHRHIQAEYKALHCKT